MNQTLNTKCKAFVASDALNSDNETSVEKTRSQRSGDYTARSQTFVSEATTPTASFKGDKSLDRNASKTSLYSNSSDKEVKKAVKAHPYDNVFGKRVVTKLGESEHATAQLSF